MNEQIKYCIFCFRNNKEVQFTREHIIPQNVGGNLFIDEVCEKCNSSLGQYIDIQILKYPEILDAFEYLNIPHNKAGILRSYFNVKAKSDNLEVNALYQDGKFKMLPKEMPDGSIIVPEENHDEVLSKIVKRDDRIKFSNVTDEYIDKEIRKIKDKYKMAEFDRLVHAPSIGRSIIKRRNKFKIVIEPKGECEIERLIAKIYYEFIYFVEGSFVFHHASDLQPLFDLIDKGKSSNIFHFSRQKSKFENPIATHQIRFVFRNSYQQLYVSFFGILDFSLMTFFHYQDFWGKIKKHFSQDGISGIHFEQNVKTGQKSFLFIDNENKFINLNA